MHAKDLSVSTGIPTSWLLAWAAQESGGPSGGWGLNAAALTKDNFYGLRKGSILQVACPTGDSGLYACFDSFYASSMSALNSARTVPATGAIWTVADVITQGIRNGDSVERIFQTVAKLGQDPLNPNYGSKLAETISAIEGRIDCLKGIGIIP